MKKQTIFVGLSGGVDSSVAALRLLRAGHNVVGVFIKVWQPAFLKCNWEAERLDAMRVAAHLKIPFLTCDAVDRYRKDVGEFFVNEYLAGRTPNPDVMCNQHVKFGAFLDFALKNGADAIATGHYARVVKVDNEYQLHRGVDLEKDQSYFLWTLTQTQLSRVYLPIGDTTKIVIRKEAAAAGLPTATKKDSQGICFLGQVEMADFLSNFTKLETGLVKDETGLVIGSHDGAIIYTIGQRHGFSINTDSKNRQAYYVVDRNIDENVITVSQNKPQVKTDDTIRLHKLNLIDIKIGTTFACEAQFRYRQTPFPVKIEVHFDRVSIVPLSTIEQPASGQSCVFYRGSLCLGGAIIA